MLPNSGYTTVNNVVIPTLKLSSNSNISITSPRLPLSARTKSPSASVSTTPRINTAPSTARIENSKQPLLTAPISARDNVVTHLQNNFMHHFSNVPKQLQLLPGTNTLQPTFASPRLDMLLSPREENPFHRSGNILVVVRFASFSNFVLQIFLNFCDETEYVQRVCLKKL